MFEGQGRLRLEPDLGSPLPCRRKHYLPIGSLWSILHRPNCRRRSHERNAQGLVCRLRESQSAYSRGTLAGTLHYAEQAVQEEEFAARHLAFQADPCLAAGERQEVDRLGLVAAAAWAAMVVPDLGRHEQGRVEIDHEQKALTVRCPSFLSVT